MSVKAEQNHRKEIRISNYSFGECLKFALIASALITIQQTEVTCPKVSHIREKYSKVIADKHEDSISKFGAILAQGIIDAGGRNATVTLQSRAGHTHMPSIVGLFVFSQFWYWFPLSHFLSLSFTPTAVIGLNRNLKQTGFWSDLNKAPSFRQMPKIEFRSNAKPSTFAYPEPLQPPKKEEKEKVQTAVLSITAKAKARQRRTEKEGEPMDVDDKSVLEMKEKKSMKEEASIESKEKDDADKSKKVDKVDDQGSVCKAVEQAFEMVENPARVLPQQLNVLSLLDTGRYVPLKPVIMGGMIMLKDVKENEPEELIEPLSATTNASVDETEPEPEPPEPFEYSDD